MIKVLRIINRFNLGGPTYNAAYLSKYLPEEFETLLVGGEIDESEAGSHYILDELGLKPIVIPEMRRAINIIDDVKAYNKIKEIILEFKPDIVHTHASKAGTLGRLAAASCGVPVILHTFHGHVFHSYFNKLKTSIFKKIERSLSKKSTCIIAISDKQKEELGIEHNIAAIDKIKVIPLGFNLSKFQDNIQEKRKRFRSDYNVAEDEIAIGIIGRLVPVKNHNFFLDAIKTVSGKTTKKIKVFIVGDGEDKRGLLDKAGQLDIPFCVSGFTENTKLLSFTSWIKEIDYVNAGLDIVALSSLNEGTPVSLIEAQAANNPIISTNVGGIENIVIEGETALLSEVGDVQTYAKNLLCLLEDDELRVRMAKKGWEHVREKFSTERLAKDVAKLYRELLRK
ncbi:MAG: glycosyltransferase involved in cell wall biosynthesis [Saprospiraceae bacterium]|jgi:glycosyltransferase involved in cell wall biosynthesis